jgi:hypothetical protein
MTYQTANNARSSALTPHENGGQAITIIASAVHDATFLMTNIQRRFNSGDANIAAMSKKAPK